MEDNSIFAALCRFALNEAFNDPGIIEGCTCIVDVLNAIGDRWGSEEPSAMTIAGAIDRITNSRQAPPAD